MSSLRSQPQTLSWSKRCLEVEKEFLLKEGIGCDLGEGEDVVRLKSDCVELFSEGRSLKIEPSVLNRTGSARLGERTRPFEETGQGRDSAAEDIVEGVVYGFDSGLADMDIVDTEITHHGLDGADLLAYGIQQSEPDLGKYQCQGNSGQTTAGAHVEHPCFRLEGDEMGQREGMKEMAID